MNHNAAIVDNLHHVRGFKSHVKHNLLGDALWLPCVFA